MFQKLEVYASKLNVGPLRDHLDHVVVTELVYLILHSNWYRIPFVMSQDKPVTSPKVVLFFVTSAARVTL